MIKEQKKDLITSLNANIEQIPKLKNYKTRQLHLIVGSANTGKTSLLNKTALNHIQTISDQNLEINSWYDEQSIFIEPPEVTKLSKQLITSALKQLTKSTRQKKLNSLIVCLNIFSAMQQPPKQFIAYLKNIAISLQQIAEFYQSSPRLHIIFTHMDYISGFCHFFDDTTAEPWGYSFKNYINHVSLLKQNTSAFKQLLKNLHTVLLHKIHHTDDKLSRYLIREFPLQIESIGNLVNACVNHLSTASSITSNVFFCCSQQNNSTFDRLTSNISQTYSLRLSNQIPQNSLDKAAFIEGILEHIKSYAPQNSSFKWSKRHTRISTIAATFICIGLSAHHFATHQQMNNAYQELLSFKQGQQTSLNELVNSLDHLSNANHAINNIHGLLPLAHVNHLSSEIKQHYTQQLNTSFIPRLAQQIEQYLNNSKSVMDSYYALKAYLMLSNAEYLDEDYLLNWLNSFWQSQQEPLLNQNKLNTLLHEALTKPFIGIEINQSLVESTRSYLQALPKSFLYFQLIENKLPQHTSRLSLAFFNNQEILLPEIYQKSNFSSVYHDKLLEIAQQFKQDSFVLNDSSENILKELQQAYIKNYHSFWQSILTKIKPASFSNYHTGQQFFDKLASHDSALEKLTQIIQKNTAAFINPSNIEQQQFNIFIANNFASINLISYQQIKQLRPLFLNLAQALKTLSLHSEPHKAAFEFAKQRFTNSTQDPISQLLEVNKQLPKPITNWLKSALSNAWSLVLQDSQQYLNTQWQDVVYKQYQNNIFNKFPFSAKEQPEVSKENFIAFFSPHGQLGQFFSEYLSPFIDTSTPQWHPKIKDGLQLPIHQQALKELIRANVIREMFFNHTEQPQVKFTLHALELDPVIAKLVLNIDGQQLEELQEQKRSQEFQWPGNGEITETTLKLKNISGEEFNFAEQGYWSWFKVLNKSNLSAYNNDMANFQLIMDLNGNAVKLLMTTSSALNPFIPKVLEQFNLPSDIT